MLMAISPKNAEARQMNIRTLSWAGLTWVDLVQPTKEATRYLAEQYHFNNLDLEDALSTRQVPKIEEYPDYLFAVFHFSVYDKQSRVSSRKQWSAFICENLLVTLRPPELKAPEEIFRECQASEEIREQYMGQGSGYLLYQLIDRAVDFYFKVLDKILTLMEDVEDNVFQEEVEAATEISILRRDIITQRRVMFPTRPLLLELEKKLKRFSKPDLTLYFSDLMDHMNKILDTLDEYTEVIEVFKDADYLHSGIRTNRTIRTLGALLMVALPVLAVAGVYTILPNSINKGSTQTFIILLVIVLLLVVITLVYFRRKRLM
jgi:magnesium transporter